jgi:hypothetical protein
MNLAAPANGMPASGGMVHRCDMCETACNSSCLIQQFYLCPECVDPSTRQFLGAQTITSIDKGRRKVVILDEDASHLAAQLFSMDMDTRGHGIHTAHIFLVKDPPQLPTRYIISKDEDMRMYACNAPQGKGCSAAA